MIVLLNSFLLVFVSEMGDKTQLLALVLAARFKKPWPIMAGILVATVLNHALAGFVGTSLPQVIPAPVLKIILALTFVAFGLWILVPDKDEELKSKRQWGPFLTTMVTFFFAEMGDKTQLATVALGAQYAGVLGSASTALLMVTLGTTIGMLGADGLAVFLGHRFTDRIPMKWVHRVASLLFILFGIGIYFGASF